MALLVVLHHDVWSWNDVDRFLGLPIGISFHVVLCLAASLVLAVVVRTSWPADPFSGFRPEAESKDYVGSKNREVREP